MAKRISPFGLLPLLLLPLVGCSDGGERMNVVLISIDSLRQDRLGIYGHRPEFAPEIPVSPHIDALAAEGVTFDSAWSTTSWTLPAHASLFTALSDRGHQVENDAFSLDPLLRTLTQEFDDDGYVTGGAYSGPYLDPKFGFGRGFDQYESGMMSADELAEVIEEIIRNRKHQGLQTTPQEIRNFRDQVSHWDVTSQRINAFAKRFLDEHGAGENPFFLFLHYFDAHYDHLPDAMEPGLAKKFDPDYTGSFDPHSWWFNTDVWEPGKAGTRKIGERDLAHILALYDAEIHWVDRHVGRVLRWLEEKGLAENTIVCVLSDHGDEFFEHGGIGHRSTLFTELTEIPLILKVPGRTPEGKRVQEVVRIYDVAPTLLDYAGVGGLEDLEGRSLRSLIEGGGRESDGMLHRIVGGPFHRDAWRNENYSVQRVFEIDLPRTRSTRMIQVKLARDRQGRPIVRVFDLRQDPLEKQPLPPGDPRRREALAAYREAFLASEELAESLRRSPPDLRYSPKLSNEERHMLSALGYAEGSDQVSQVEEALGREPFRAPFPVPVVPRD